MINMVKQLFNQKLECVLNEVDAYNMYNTFARKAGFSV
jgi:hypothetical protein